MICTTCGKETICGVTDERGFNCFDCEPEPFADEDMEQGDLFDNKAIFS